MSRQRCFALRGGERNLDTVGAQQRQGRFGSSSTLFICRHDRLYLGQLWENFLLKSVYFFHAAGGSTGVFFNARKLTTGCFQQLIDACHIGIDAGEIGGGRCQS